MLDFAILFSTQNGKMEFSYPNFDRKFHILGYTRITISKDKNKE